MEEKPAAPETKPAVTEKPKSSDLRIFAIALLTSIIAIALYHFGVGFCKIFFCSEYDCSPNTRYMLVRVLEAPEFPVGDEEAEMKGRHRMHHDGGEMPHGGPRFKGKRPGGMPGGPGRRPFPRKGPAPEKPKKADAPAKAPAPAEAPAGAPAGK